MSIARPISRPISRPIVRGIVRGDTAVIDPDAAAWIAKVEAADGQALEPEVVAAMNTLFSGLRTDGVLEGLDSWRIYAGPRTLAGALTAVRGPDPENVGPFVQGDLTRDGGLKGNGSSKLLDLKVRNEDYGQNDMAWWTVITEMPTVGVPRIFLSSTGNPTIPGSTRMAAASTVVSTMAWRNRTATVNAEADMVALGFVGMSRLSAANYRAIGGEKNILITQSSQAPNSNDIYEFASPEGSGVAVGEYSNHRSLASGVGPGLTEAQMLALKARLETYWANLQTIFA